MVVTAVFISNLYYFHLTHSRWQTIESILLSSMSALPVRGGLCEPDCRAGMSSSPSRFTSIACNVDRFGPTFNSAQQHNCIAMLTSAPTQLGNWYCQKNSLAQLSATFHMFVVSTINQLSKCGALTRQLTLCVSFTLNQWAQSAIHNISSSSRYETY